MLKTRSGDTRTAFIKEKRIDTNTIIITWSTYVRFPRCGDGPRVSDMPPSPQKTGLYARIDTCVSKESRAVVVDDTWSTDHRVIFPFVFTRQDIEDVRRSSPSKLCVRICLRGTSIFEARHRNTALIFFTFRVDERESVVFREKKKETRAVFFPVFEFSAKTSDRNYYSQTTGFSANAFKRISSRRCSIHYSTNVFIDRSERRIAAAKLSITKNLFYVNIFVFYTIITIINWMYDSVNCSVETVTDGAMDVYSKTVRDNRLIFRCYYVTRIRHKTYFVPKTCTRCFSPNAQYFSGFQRYAFNRTDHVRVWRRPIRNRRFQATFSEISDFVFFSLVVRTIENVVCRRKPHWTTTGRYNYEYHGASLKSEWKLPILCRRRSVFGFFVLSLSFHSVGRAPPKNAYR